MKINYDEIQRNIFIMHKIYDTDYILDIPKDKNLGFYECCLIYVFVTGCINTHFVQILKKLEKNGLKIDINSTYTLNFIDKLTKKCPDDVYSDKWIKFFLTEPELRLYKNKGFDVINEKDYGYIFSHKIRNTTLYYGKNLIPSPFANFSYSNTFKSKYEAVCAIQKFNT